MKVGKIIAINFSQLRVKISSEIKGNSINLRGNIYYFGNLGSYLKVKNAISEVVVCEVMSIFDSDITKEKHSFDVESNRELLIKPIGTIDNKKEFTLGVGIYPSLYSDVEIVTHEDMHTILKTKKEPSQEVKKNIHRAFTLGRSKNLINYPIDVNIDSFFNIHSAVLGNSGSGKSNTIAHIIQEIHKKTDHSALGSKIIIFDVNGEYKEAFNGSANKNICLKFFKPNLASTDAEFANFVLPHFLLSLDEWSAFLLASEATQRPFWNRVLQESYRFYSIGIGNAAERNKFINYLRFRICSLVGQVLSQADTDTARITTAASILGSIKSIILNDSSLSKFGESLVDEIDTLQASCGISYGQNNDKLASALANVADGIDYELVEEVNDLRIPAGTFFDHKFLRIAADLILLEEDARGNRQIRGYTATMLTRLDFFLEHPDCQFMRESVGIKSTSEFLDYFWDGDSSQSQLIIVDTSELSPDILETLTSVLTRVIFDQRRKLSGEHRRRQPVHFILDEAHRYIKRNYEYLLKENIFEKIAREGRKFSTYLLISSQRPSELSETVLSQCANFVIHRIQNERDMNFIQAILPYYSEDFTNKIKQSIPGEALVFGNCVSMPLHVKVQESAPPPNSKNCKVAEEWFIPKAPPVASSSKSKGR